MGRDERVAAASGSADAVRDATAEAPGRASPARLLAALGVLVVVPVALLWRSLPNAYHLDDAYRVEANAELERVAPIGRHFLDPYTSTSQPTIAQYRPLLPLSLSLTTWAADRLDVERVVAHRAGNLALHVATGVLVLFLLAELLRRAPPRVRARRFELAFCGALLFAVHPVAHVPVQYVCARDLGMANLLLVAATLVYARMRRRRGDSALGWAAVLALVGASLAAKTNGAVFFGVVLAFELTLAPGGPGRLRDRGVWLRAAAAASPTAAFLVWTAALGFSDAEQLVVEGRAPLAYGLTELKVHLFHYLRNAFWPLRLRPLPDVEASGAGDPRVWLGGAVVAGSLALAWLGRRRRPELAFAVFAYWTLFALTSSAIPLRSFAADYRQVPSLVYLALLFAAGALSAVPPRGTLAATAALAAGLAVVAARQGEVWRTEASLWRDAVAKGTTGRGHQSFARAIQGEDPALAEEHYQIALREAPNDVFARIGLGMLRISRGHVADGLAQVERAAREAPDWALTQHWYAKALRMLGRREEAAAASARAAELEPRNPEYLYWAAADRQALGDHAAALPLLRELRRIAGVHGDSRFREAWAWQRTGRLDKAIPLYEARLEVAPDDHQSWFNLAHARMTRAEFERAAEGFERALALEPRYHEVHYHLARCYAELGRPELAEEHRARYEASQGRSR